MIFATDQEDAMKQLKEMFEPEELHPELQMYLDDRNGFAFISHPLVYDIMYMPQSNKRLNKMLEHKKAYAQKAIEEKDWGRYIFIHERPYRFEALITILDVHKAEVNAEIWQLIREVWIDSENIVQNKRGWKHILSTLQGGKDFMTSEDKVTYDALPDVVEVYHGTSGNRVEDFSWTTDFQIATKFGYRLAPAGSVPKVFKAMVKKSDIFAYTDSRSERECIILKPVKNKETIILP